MGGRVRPPPAKKTVYLKGLLTTRAFGRESGGILLCGFGAIREPCRLRRDGIDSEEELFGIG